MPADCGHGSPAAARKFPSDPQAAVAEAIQRITRLIGGERDDLIEFDSTSRGWMRSIAASMTRPEHRAGPRCDVCRARRARGR